MSFRHIALLFVAIPLACGTSAQAEKRLQGEVEKSDHVVRFQRPQTPTLRSSTFSTEKLGVNDQAYKTIADFGDNDFSKDLRAGMAKSDHTKPASTIPGQATDAKQAEIEANEEIIAWEEWHKRVCEAIYQRWVENSNSRGIAHTTITVTKDKHITITIHDLTVDGDYAPFEQMELKDGFARAVLASVEPLDGLDVLTFPEKSRRQVTEFHPYFRKANSSGYDWRTDDYERVTGHGHHPRQHSGYTWRKDDYEHVQGQTN